MQRVFVPPPSGVSSSRGQDSGKLLTKSNFSFRELRQEHTSSELFGGDRSLDFVSKIRFVNYLSQVKNFYHQFELMKMFLVSSDQVQSIYKRLKVAGVENLEQLSGFLAGLISAKLTAQQRRYLRDFLTPYFNAGVDCLGTDQGFKSQSHTELGQGQKNLGDTDHFKQLDPRQNRKALKVALKTFLLGTNLTRMDQKSGSKEQTNDLGHSTISLGEKSLSKNTQLDSSVTTFKDHGHGLTNSSYATVTFRTPENQDLPITCSSDEVELVCREAISNECNIKDSFKSKPFDFQRVFTILCTSKPAKIDHASSPRPRDFFDFATFNNFLKSLDNLGYSFSEANSAMLFRRLDRLGRGLVGREDFEEEFQSLV